MRGGTFLFIVSLLIILFIPLSLLQWAARSTMVLVLLSYLYSRLQKRYIWIARELEETLVYRHSTTAISLILTNYLPLPVPGLVVSDEPGALISDNNDRRIFRLSPGQRLRMTYEVKSQNRGRYRLGPVGLQSADPLGFFPWQRILYLPGSVIVFPRIHPLHLLLDRGSPIGAIHSKNPLNEDPTQHRSYHEYQPGDDPRRIQWMVSARTGILQVSEYLATLTVPAIILLNLNPLDYLGRRVFHHTERAIEVAASAAQFWAASGEQFALITNGVQPVGIYDETNRDNYEFIPAVSENAVFESTTEPLVLPFGKGREQASVLLQSLATVFRPSQGTSEMTWKLFEQIRTLRPGPGTRVIYIGPSLDTNLFSRAVEDFHSTWNLDLWVVDEKINSEGRIHGGTVLPGKKYRVLGIREYGEDVFDD